MITALAIIGGVVGLGVVISLVIFLVLANDKANNKNPFQ